MSKGSGGTRGSSWRDKRKNDIDNEGFGGGGSGGGGNERREKDDLAYLVDKIVSEEFTFGETYDKKAYDIWDNLSDEERIEVLKRAKYTGMIQGDDVNDFSFYKQDTKEDMVLRVQDQLENVASGYDMEDTNMYMVKIKGHSVIDTRDLHKPLTKAQIKNIEWISADGGLSSYSYYSKNEAAHNDMMKHMNFHEFKNGVETSDINGKLSDKYKKH